MVKKSIAIKKVDREILKLYRDMYYDYRQELTKVKPGSLKEMWLNTQMKALGEEMKYIGKQYEGVLTKEMESIINSTLKTQETYFNTAAEKNGLPKDLFDNTFTKMNSKVLREVMSGNLYKDGRGLSSRIWKDGKQFNHDIDYVIKEGIAKKRSIYDIAKDLEKYVKPGERKDYEWKKLYPNAGKKVVDYNAYRLANTSISHAYQTALARVNRQNPFMEGIEWRGGNHARSCELCKERNGKVYGAKETKGRFTIDPLPLDHPNGFCENIPIVDDLERVGDRIHNWINGKGDKELDGWFKTWGDQYKGPEDIKKSPEYKEKSSKPVGRDDKWFDDNFKKIKKSISPDQWNDIKEHMKKAPEFVQDWWARGAAKFKFENSSGDGAYYSPQTKSIHMNIGKEKRNPRGAYTTFFHEFGHLIDYKLGPAARYGRNESKDSTYYNKIITDYENLLKKNASAKMWELKPQIAKRQAESTIDRKLKEHGDYISGVSDIIGGITDNQVKGKWGHSTEYWNRGNKKYEITSEMWAHMSSCYANEKNYEIMKEYFPESLKHFEEMIKKHKA